MVRPHSTVVALLLLLVLTAGGCDRAEGPGKDKIDELPRGTGGTPATQATQPAPGPDASRP